MLKPNNQDRRWQILDSEYLIRRPWLTARKDRVRLPNGVENNEYYVLEYPDWVNVVALTRDGRFLMERQYRHGLQLTSYEICAGVCEAGETPLQSAQRELYEETGYGGGTWTPWMDISANTSTMTNLTHCFPATDAEPVSPQHLAATAATPNTPAPTAPALGTQAPPEHPAQPPRRHPGAQARPTRAGTLTPTC